MQLTKGSPLNLSDPFTTDSANLADLSERAWAVFIDTESQFDDLTITRLQLAEQTFDAIPQLCPLRNLVWTIGSLIH